LIYFYTGKMGFGLLGLGFGHWEWEMSPQKWEGDTAEYMPAGFTVYTSFNP
jgi:hypothetical protein